MVPRRNLGGFIPVLLAILVSYRVVPSGTATWASPSRARDGRRGVDGLVRPDIGFA
jgi:hypothetical protein